MRTKLLAQLVGFVVILPTTLGATFFSLLGVTLVAKSIQHNEELGTAALIVLCLTGGWLGIIALWRAYIVLATGQLAFNSTFIWIGFSCGSLVSLALIGMLAGPLLSGMLFFGWPLLAVAGFTPMLLLRGAGAAPSGPSA